MIMMSNKVLMCFIVFFNAKNMSFVEKNQIAISNVKEDILTFKKIPQREKPASA